MYLLFEGIPRKQKCEVIYALRSSSFFFQFKATPLGNLYLQLFLVHMDSPGRSQNPYSTKSKESDEGRALFLQESFLESRTEASSTISHWEEGKLKPQ